MTSLYWVRVQDKLKISAYWDNYKESEYISVFHVLIHYYELTCNRENSVDPYQLYRENSVDPDQLASEEEAN